ncbi:hypothetical protein [Haliscomenobacter sp.]|uniref:hypothetical protein n=1 Tax=Haliscomenobacter sp. TaxID=2717303 RepID=UPI00359493F8
MPEKRECGKVKVSSKKALSSQIQVIQLRNRAACAYVFPIKKSNPIATNYLLKKGEFFRIVIKDGV